MVERKLITHKHFVVIVITTPVLQMAACNLVRLPIPGDFSRALPQTRNAPNTPWTCPLANTICRCRMRRGKTRDGADRAWFAELLKVGAVEGTGAVELQRHSLNIDAQDPGARRAGAGATDVWRFEDGRDGNVVLALDFVDSLVE
jgi:hypothetical protein